MKLKFQNIFLILLASLYLLAPMAQEFSALLHSTSHQLSIVLESPGETYSDHHHSHSHQKEHSHQPQNNAHEHSVLSLINKFIANSDEENSDHKIFNLRFYKHIPNEKAICVQDIFEFKNSTFFTFSEEISSLYFSPNFLPPKKA